MGQAVSVLEGGDDLEDVTVTVERMADAESVAEDDGSSESLVDVEVGWSADADAEADVSVTTVVVVVADAVDSTSEVVGISGVGRVKTTVVVVVVVVVKMVWWLTSGIKIDDRSGRLIEEAASSST